MLTRIGLGHVRELLIDPDLLRKLWALAAASATEISGFGEAHEVGGIIHIQKPFHVPEQEGSMVETKIGQEQLAPLITEYVKSGRSLQNLRFWFHTHGSMPAFFSATDEDTIRDLSSTMPLFVAGVFNRRGDTMWRVVWHDVHTEWEYEIEGGLLSTMELAVAKSEFEKKVKRGWWDKTKHKTGFR